MISNPSSCFYFRWVHPTHSLCLPDDLVQDCVGQTLVPRRRGNLASHLRGVAIGQKRGLILRMRWLPDLSSLLTFDSSNWDQDLNFGGELFYSCAKTVKIRISEVSVQAPGLGGGIGKESTDSCARGFLVVRGSTCLLRQ